MLVGLNTPDTIWPASGNEPAASNPRRCGQRGVGHRPARQPASHDTGQAAMQLAGCHRAPSSAEAVTAGGIAWFQGSIDEAFAAAAGQHKLVFLYWGAEWCPPCHDLKAHVFSRRDFQDKLRQFVLDRQLLADAPAQMLRSGPIKCMTRSTICEPRSLMTPPPPAVVDFQLTALSGSRLPL